MAKVRFVVAQIEEKKFSGGLLCIFEYANGLQALGHDVVVTPLLPSHSPQWFAPRFALDLAVAEEGLALGALLKNAVGFATRRDAPSKSSLKRSFARIARKTSAYGGYNFKRALGIERFGSLPREADVTIATSFETAFPVAAHATGKKFYFMQHYEPYFAIDIDRPAEARLDAELTYRLPLQKIANSTWLKSQLAACHGIENVLVNPNAIDHDVFYRDSSASPPPDQFVVISYGGRGATWKGFREAAEAIRLARARIPNLEWRVYGDALLPPDNDIAPYRHLGFIAGAALRRAYSSAHVTLCPSWYESFPLFPLEAMACGSAVVTTPYGTEDYARDGENALVVRPRDPQAMAEAIKRLWADAPLRERLARQGMQDAKRLNWQRAVHGMNEIISREH